MTDGDGGLASSLAWRRARRESLRCRVSSTGTCASTLRGRNVIFAVLRKNLIKPCAQLVARCVAELDVVAVIRVAVVRCVLADLEGLFLISLQSGLYNPSNKLRVAACALPRTPRLAQLASTTPPIDRPRAARRIFSQFFFPAPRTRVIGRPKSPITKSAAAARKPRRGSRQCTGGSGFPSGWRW